MVRKHRARIVVLTLSAVLFFSWIGLAVDERTMEIPGIESERGYGVSQIDAALHDESRDRVLPIRAYIPAFPNHSRLPTVVFSHGGGESGEAFAYLAPPGPMPGSCRSS